MSWSHDNVSAGRLHFTTDIGEAVKDAAIVMIAVGTPTRQLDGNADLQYVYAAAEEIARALDHYAVIVTKSTVPAGTGFQVKRIVSEANPGARVRRRVESGIPEGRQRDLRFRDAGSHRHRHR